MSHLARPCQSAYLPYSRAQALRNGSSFIREENQIPLLLRESLAFDPDHELEGCRHIPSAPHDE